MLARTTVAASPLRDVPLEAGTVEPSGIGELDRVLGGGFVPGSTTLLYGEPGVGKSTLALLALREVGTRGDVLLIASEESASQVARRARRLGDVPARLDVATTTSVDAAADLLGERRRSLCVVDSLSAMSAIRR